VVNVVPYEEKTMADPWTIKDTLTTIGSTIGSVSGVGAVLWHVLNWRKDRLDLRLKAEIAWVEDPALEGIVKALKAKPVVRIWVTNHGRRDTFVKGLAGTFETGEPPVLLSEMVAVIPASDGLPRWLKDGEPIKVDCKLDLLGPSKPYDRAVTALHAVDGREGHWRLPPREFLKIQEEARALLAKADKDSGVEEVAAANRAEIAGIAAENRAELAAKNRKD
jgi:hypothetical protein